MGGNVGSVWRRWDLHIHTPFTKLSNGFEGSSDDAIWEKYIDALEAAAPQAYGITDYFSCDTIFTLIDRYKAKYPESSKALFINIELRLSDSIDAKNGNPNLHVIFDNDVDQCPRNKIERFLATLKTKGDDDSGARIPCSDLSTTKDYASASVSFDDVKAALEDTFGDAKPYLLAFPAKNDGIRTTDAKSQRKVLISDKLDRNCDLFFGDANSREYFLGAGRYDSGESLPKPAVSGSDAHSFADLERLDGNVVGYPPAWIKADLTFRGLQQICFEPESRVFIGAEPPVEQRKTQQPTKMLSNLKINHIPEYDGSRGIWFKGVDVPLNPELTAIIGNKGSGKSALVDIIGLLGDSRLEAYFSFLSDSPDNKKFRQRGYAENFQAEVLWQSKTSVGKRLSESVDRTKPEGVRYLPQNYFEQLTNEIQIDEFRREIEDVVFSHVEETERLGTGSFKDLQDLKTQQSRNETSALKTRLRQVNFEILELETSANPQFRKSLAAALDAKKEELRALEAAKPAEVAAPDSQTEEQRQLSERLQQLANQLDELRRAEQSAVDTISQLKNRQQRLLSLKDAIESLSARVKEGTDALRPTALEFELDIDKIVKMQIDLTDVEIQRTSVGDRISTLERDNAVVFEPDHDFRAIVGLPDIRGAIAFHVATIDALREQLGTPQRKYQAYLDKLAQWNSQRAGILGSEVDPQGGTIRALEAQIAFIDTDLAAQINEKRTLRSSLARQIFESKQKVLKFYADIKASVDQRLQVVRTASFSVEITASFVLERDFSEDFLKLIKKNRRGPFHGANDPERVLKGLVSEVDWDSFDSVEAFVEKVLAEMTSEEGGTPLLLEEQVVHVKDFYDFLYSLEYFAASYELRLGGKNLNELSPGEKGLLLLVFYLQLDKDNIPLVIDQPEDNLDNESIFAILANCIREAKKHRQVILVTHNPNLAVGADAEQIIYVKLDKADSYRFSYESGAIENPRINQRIIDILEGSQPAFVKRRLKYHIA
ncbi:hypothetical protein QA648_17925 [Rhizobium sp. CB3171]|uniref:TrlF family AAA-like ATPase n=1 Tax=Rhizobium sp. CB3171 TaxID=3039157 RepID=UPI0024B1DA6B|nr:AAA family ATPase [Rhizobium sp. CB3171]WFU01955.1 hypothetical protein QA648_17925 [Rhizobium sp. CB3171]